MATVGWRCTILTYEKTLSYAGDAWSHLQNVIPLLEETVDQMEPGTSKALYVHDIQVLKEFVNAYDIDQGFEVTY